jgi:hypothetical protein
MIYPGTYVLLQDFGTTATVALYFKATKHILVANCGDSDAIVGRKISNGSIKKRSKRTPVNMLQLDDDHYMEAILLTVSDNVMQNKSEIARVRRVREPRYFTLAKRIIMSWNSNLSCFRTMERRQSSSMAICLPTTKSTASTLLP